jgi:putative membrane protein
MTKRTIYIILTLLFAITWIWAAIEPLHYDDWLLENILVFIFIPIIFLTARSFEFSIISYSFITLFILLHLIGSHYTYAEVPWGVTLGEWWGTDRNMYDRLIHFLFGLLLVYPIREVSVRLAKNRGFWGYMSPFMVVSALAGFYEVIEWTTAVLVDPEAGTAFLGTQGDIWDAQKDMLIAMVGAIITLILVMIFNMIFDKGFFKEFRESFHLPKDDRPLGEVKVEELWER